MILRVFPNCFLPTSLIISVCNKPYGVNCHSEVAQSNTFQHFLQKFSFFGFCQCFLSLSLCVEDNLFCCCFSFSVLFFTNQEGNLGLCLAHLLNINGSSFSNTCMSNEDILHVELSMKTNLQYCNIAIEYKHCPFNQILNFIDMHLMILKLKVERKIQQKCSEIRK